MSNIQLGSYTVLGAPDRPNISCVMHDTCLCQMVNMTEERNTCKIIIGHAVKTIAN